MLLLVTYVSCEKMKTVDVVGESLPSVEIPWWTDDHPLAVDRISNLRFFFRANSIDGDAPEANAPVSSLTSRTLAGNWSLNVPSEAIPPHLVTEASGSSVLVFQKQSNQSSILHAETEILSVMEKATIVLSGKFVAGGVFSFTADDSKDGVRVSASAQGLSITIFDSLGDSVKKEIPLSDPNAIVIVQIGSPADFKVMVNGLFSRAVDQKVGSLAKLSMVGRNFMLGSDGVSGGDFSLRDFAIIPSLLSEEQCRAVSASLAMDYNMALPRILNGDYWEPESGAPPPKPPPVDPPLAVRFPAVQKIIQANCLSSCHEHDAWVNYADAKRKVVAGKPNESSLYNRLFAIGGTLMPPTQPVSLADKTTIQKWILDGALE